MKNIASPPITAKGVALPIPPITARIAISIPPHRITRIKFTSALHRLGVEVFYIHLRPQLLPRPVPSSLAVIRSRPCNSPVLFRYWESPKRTRASLSGVPLTGTFQRRLPKLLDSHIAL